jgi:hypothetical protein
MPNSNRNVPYSVLAGRLSKAGAYLRRTRPFFVMKRFILFNLLIFLPAIVRGQYTNNNLLVVKEIYDGVVCDSCIVTMAGNITAIPDKISFLTPNRDNQFLYSDATLTRELSTVDPSKFFVSMGSFSLDFYPFGKVLARKGDSIPYIDFKGFTVQDLCEWQAEKRLDHRSLA